jgi:multiple sugar transport system ATP-binding protein
VASITLRAINKSFGRVQVIEDLNLVIPDHQMTCLLGPSGCGKTTILRLIAGLEMPDSGDILFDERNVTLLDPRDRNVGMMFQGYALYPHMSVADNMAYSLKVRKVDRAERDRRVERVAAMLGISDLLTRAITQLSGGQQQRVALGRAIVQQPSVYLLDEPISNLDARLRSTMRGEIKRLQKELGTTMVVVAHDQLDALAMADLIGVMNGGVIEQYGTPDDVYNQPATIFVAEFVGEPRMNVLPCTLTRDGGRDLLRTDAFSVPCNVADGLPTADLALGIRPQHVRLIGTTEPTEPAFQALIRVATPEGADVIYDLTVGPYTIKARTPPEMRLAMDSAVYVTFPPQHLYLFDRRSGRRLAAGAPSMECHGRAAPRLDRGTEGCVAVWRSHGELGGPDTAIME